MYGRLHAEDVFLWSTHQENLEAFIAAYILVMSVSVNGGVRENTAARTAY